MRITGINGNLINSKLFEKIISGKQFWISIFKAESVDVK